VEAGAALNDMAACGHRLCELVGEGCSLAVTRSRGCHASGWATAVAPELLDEVRALLARIDANDRAAAARLARIVRGEALEGRNLVAHARDDDPALAAELARLLR
jgi:hypothetical protein